MSDTGRPTSTEDAELRLEEAKERMMWSEDREPTLLEYLRYYKSDMIREVHIEAVIAAYCKQHADAARVDELRQAIQSDTTAYSHLVSKKYLENRLAQLTQAGKETA